MAWSYFLILLVEMNKDWILQLIKYKNDKKWYALKSSSPQQTIENIQWFVEILKHI